MIIKVMLLIAVRRLASELKLHIEILQFWKGIKVVNLEADAEQCIVLEDLLWV
jgi:hypothetical protein